MNRLVMLYPMKNDILKVRNDALTIDKNISLGFKIKWLNEFEINLAESGQSIYIKYGGKLIRISNHDYKRNKLRKGALDCNEVVSVIIKENNIEQVKQFELIHQIENKESEKINE